MASGSPFGVTRKLPKRGRGHARRSSAAEAEDSVTLRDAVQQTRRRSVASAAVHDAAHQMAIHQAEKEKQLDVRFGGERGRRQKGGQRSGAHLIHGMMSSAATKKQTELDTSDRDELFRRAQALHKEEMTQAGVKKETKRLKARPRQRRDKPHTIGAKRRRSASEAEGLAGAADSGSGEKGGARGAMKGFDAKAAKEDAIKRQAARDKRLQKDAANADARRERAARRSRAANYSLAMQMADAAAAQRLVGLAQRNYAQELRNTVVDVNIEDMLTGEQRHLELTKISVGYLRNAVQKAFGLSVASRFLLRYASTGSDITQDLLVALLGLPNVKARVDRDDQAVTLADIEAGKATADTTVPTQLFGDGSGSHLPSRRTSATSKQSSFDGSTAGTRSIPPASMTLPPGNAKRFRTRSTSADGSTVTAASNRPRSRSVASAASGSRARSDSDGSEVVRNRKGSVATEWTRKIQQLSRRKLDLQLFVIPEPPQYRHIFLLVLWSVTWVANISLISKLEFKPAPGSTLTSDGTPTISHPSRYYDDMALIVAFGTLFNVISAWTILLLEWKSSDSWFRTWLEEDSSRKRLVAVALLFSAANVRAIKVVGSHVRSTCCRCLPYRMDAPLMLGTFGLWLDRHTISLGNGILVFTLPVFHNRVILDDAPEINDSAWIAAILTGICLGIEIINRLLAVMNAPHQHKGGLAALCGVHIEEIRDEFVGDSDLESDDNSVNPSTPTASSAYKRTFGDPPSYESNVVLPWLSKSNLLTCCRGVATCATRIQRCRHDCRGAGSHRDRMAACSICCACCVHASKAAGKGAARASKEAAARAHQAARRQLDKRKVVPRQYSAGTSAHSYGSATSDDEKSAS